METKINIADILKDKPKGIKLYADAFGELKYDGISNDKDPCIFVEAKEWGNYIFHNDGKYSKYGEPILFPSKEMHDWHKFFWKKGDVLASEGEHRLHVIFEGFEDDTYTTFKGKHYLCNYDDNEEYNEEEYNDYEKEISLRTVEFEKDNEDAAQTYINLIEELFGGKLNRETLEIEPSQPEFKDGDIITIMPHIGDKFIYLFKAEDDEKYYGRAFLDGDIVIVNDNGYVQKDFCTARPSTEEEKQMLFSALAKEGKAWDSEKKQIVDIKKEPKFKPFEKVLVRDSYYDIWRASLFSHIKEDDGRYVTTCLTWKFCIPYIGNEHLLGTIKDVEG